jgi:hypothetical protein
MQLVLFARKVYTNVERTPKRRLEKTMYPSIVLASPVLVFLAAPIAAQLPATHFKRISEPSEHAFTILAPEGWKASGGLRRVNPMTAHGILNSNIPKLDFTLSSADGRITLQWIPEIVYYDMRKSPAAGMFPPGSNYNGAIVAPPMNALSYLDQAVFRRMHPRAANVQVKGKYPLPNVAQSYQQVLRKMSALLNFRYDVALLVLSYNEGGGAWDEVLYTAMQDTSSMGVGGWSNKDTFSARAPAGELEKIGPIMTVVLNSVQLNPTWVEGELKGQIQRGEIARRTQQEVQRINEEMVEHRQHTNSEINNQIYHNLMRTDEYVNPITKQVEVGSSEWSNRWVNENGDAIYTNDPNYDPTKSGLTGFERSQPRKRGPD